LITKFYSAVEIKRDEGGGACAGMGEGRDNAGIGVEVWERGETMQELVWKPETNTSLEEVSVEARIKIKVNRLLGRRWCKWKGKYKIDLQVML
jgi:hypothetical protein